MVKLSFTAKGPKNIEIFEKAEKIALTI